MPEALAVTHGPTSRLSLSLGILLLVSSTPHWVGYYLSCCDEYPDNTIPEFILALSSSDKRLTVGGA